MANIANLHIDDNSSNIGVGSYGHVKKGRYKNEVVAVKIFNLGVQNDFIKEARNLTRISHDNIIKILAYGEHMITGNKYETIVMEYAEMGSLHKLLHTDKHIEYSLGHAINWMYQAANAVNYLHNLDPSIMHRDLKPMNLLLKDRGRILKICDFGTSCTQHTQMTTGRGTPLYMAPELSSDSHYNKKCDVFSYGITLWEVLTRKKPYFELGNKVTSFQIVLKVISGYRPPMIKDCPTVLARLYEKSVDTKPDKRPDMGLIYVIMSKMNEVINKNGLKPLEPESPIHKTHTLESGLNLRIFSASNTNIMKSSQSNLNLASSQSTAENSTNAFDRNTIRSSFNVTVKPITSRRPSHKRTRSDDPYLGNNFIPPASSINSITDELNEPLEALSNNPKSLEIHREHYGIYKKDLLLTKEISQLEKIKLELEKKIKNQEEYESLMRQKNTLINDNKVLEEKAND